MCPETVQSGHENSDDKTPRFIVERRGLTLAESAQLHFKRNSDCTRGKRQTQYSNVNDCYMQSSWMFSGLARYAGPENLKNAGAGGGS